MASCAPTARAAVPVTATPIATNGAAAPDGNGTFGTFTSYGDACVNDSGHVAFYAVLIATSGGTSNNEVLVRGRVGESPVLVAREGDLLPDGSGALGHLHTPPRVYAMNNVGRVMFMTDLTATPGGTSDNSGIFSSVGPGTLVEHARRGDPTPVGNTFGNFLFPTINNTMPATIGFYGTLGPTGSGGTRYFFEHGGSMTSPTILGVAAPEGNGTLNNFELGWPAALHPFAAEAAMNIHLTGTLRGSQDDDGIYRIAEGGSTEKILREYDPAPGGSRYGGNGVPVYNLLHNVATTVPRNPTSDGEMIAMAGDGADEKVQGENESPPDSNGVYDGFSAPSISAGNLVSYTAWFKNTLGGGADDSGILRGDGLITHLIAREGWDVPEGNGTFGQFDLTGTTTAINAAGQVLFTARLTGTPRGTQDDRGLYLWDEFTGITKIVREGDIVNGSTVTEISSLTARDFGGFRVLNDKGEVVARLQVGAGFPEAIRDGIYIFRPEFPTTVGESAPAARGSIALSAGPSPMRDVTSIRCALPRDAVQADIAILDATGRTVRRLHSGPLVARSAFLWNGRDDAGVRVPAGVYHAVVRTSDGAGASRAVVCVR
jgi:hypothetical protein